MLIDSNNLLSKSIVHTIAQVALRVTVPIMNQRFESSPKVQTEENSITFQNISTLHIQYM